MYAVQKVNKSFFFDHVFHSYGPHTGYKPVPPCEILNLFVASSSHAESTHYHPLMTTQKTALLIGLDPHLIDFSKPGYPPGMSAEKVYAGLNSAQDELAAVGCAAEMCYTDFGQTAAAVVEKHLKQKSFDCVMIGAGVRIVPANFLLFEKLINVIHEHAPKARICFNTLPNDTAEAVKRWI